MLQYRAELLFRSGAHYFCHLGWALSSVISWLFVPVPLLMKVVLLERSGSVQSILCPHTQALSNVVDALAHQVVQVHPRCPVVAVCFILLTLLGKPL